MAGDRRFAAGLADASSHGLWGMTAPTPTRTAALGEKLDVDVAVVGAGYAGLSAALRLAEAGAKVAVLEAAQIGFGGAGRNVGLVNAGLWLRPDDVCQRLGAERGERLLDLLGDGPARVFALIDRHAIACDAEPVGTLHCAVGTDGLAEITARAEQWQRRGAPVALLDADEARRRIGGGAYAGALLDRRAGTIQPLAFARGLAQAAITAGARIFTASPVLAIEDAGTGHVLKTVAGALRAGWVIVATDAYGFGPCAGLRREQVHLPYFNFATAPLPPDILAGLLPGREGAWDTRAVLSSFRRDRAGRLVFGSVGALSGTGRRIHRAWAMRAMRRIFPQLGQVGVDVGFEAGWYGHIGMTVDDLPRLHQLGRNVVAVSGYNGRGIAPGTVFGALLADLALGRTAAPDLPLPASPVEEPPWRVAREALYALGSQLAHLADARF